MTIFPTFIDELEARTHIQDVLVSFCRGIDRKDWGLLLSTFHEDATDDHGMVAGRAHDVLVPALQARHAAITHSAHYLTNVSVHFTSVDAASVESYVWVVQRERSSADGTDSRSVASVRYVDVFERRDGTWRISHRALVYGDLITLAADAETFSLPASFRVQSRDGSDPIELQEHALGIDRRPTR